MQGPGAGSVKLKPGADRSSTKRRQGGRKVLKALLGNRIPGGWAVVVLPGYRPLADREPREGARGVGALPSNKMLCSAAIRRADQGAHQKR